MEHEQSGKRQLLVSKDTPAMYIYNTIGEELDCIMFIPRHSAHQCTFRNVDNVIPSPGSNVTPSPGSNVTPSPGSNVTPSPGSNVTPSPGTNVTPVRAATLPPVRAATLPPVRVDDEVVRSRLVRLRVHGAEVLDFSLPLSRQVVPRLVHPLVPTRSWCQKSDVMAAWIVLVRDRFPCFKRLAQRLGAVISNRH